MRKEIRKIPSLKIFRMFKLMFSTFSDNKMSFQCVALSYFVTLAIVPLLAVVFTVTGGLGLSDWLNKILFSILPTSPDLVQSIMEKADNIINTAKSGVVGSIASFTFIWSVIWLMFQVERVFNNVWGINKNPRKIYKRFSFYLLALVLTPFVVIVFFAGIAVYANITNLIGLDFENVRFLPKVLGWLGFYIISVLTFSAMYKFIPAPRVKYRYAFRSALFSALVFVIFQYIYLEAQVVFSRMNAVYGALAAIPLFLMWLNFSWQIIIYGAELTYSYQHIDTNQVSE